MWLLLVFRVDGHHPKPDFLLQRKVNDYRELRLNRPSAVGVVSSFRRWDTNITITSQALR